MARIGTIYILKDWLTTYKTYQGPINLRFIYPIDLTKTYCFIVRKNSLIVLLYLLGRVRHGVLHRAKRNWEYMPPDWMFTVERFYRGCRDYLYRIKYNVSGLLHKIKVREAVVSAPQILHIRKFQTKYYGAPNTIKINDAEGKLVDGRGSTGGAIRYCRYGLDQPTLLFGPLTYSEMIKHLIDLVE